MGREVYNLHSSSLGTVRDRIMGGASLSRHSQADPSRGKGISAPIFARRPLPNSGTGQSGRYRNSCTTWWPPNWHRRGLQVLVLIAHRMVTSCPDRGASFCATTECSAPNLHFDHELVGAKLDRAWSFLLEFYSFQANQVIL